jgi:hypothetical protein|tara:strand:+ start:235 stop:366 length:132 start_codon:yes stop_codon:yes gene_type:complete
MVLANVGIDNDSQSQVDNDNGSQKEIDNGSQSQKIVNLRFMAF